MAKPANGKGGEYGYVFPIGFYTSFGGYLSSNLSVINDLKEQGYVFLYLHLYRLLQLLIWSI